ncbi:MAG: hypothetical protein IKM39_02555 [Clostridia bacterium]|nr:hypothetical protein [Clostridia bacterium]
MSVFTVLGIAMFLVTAGVLLRGHQPVLGICLSVAGGMFLLLGCVNDLVEITARLEDLIAKTQTEMAFFRILLKALGICYICQFAGDLCRDAQETALAGYVELAGKITVVGLSLPLISKVVETVVKLIEV